MAEVPRSFIHEMLRSHGAIARADSSDGELLDAFVNAGDPLAFEMLVRRHAGLVWRICRGMLDNDHDAEDAFQATFLVFVRKAGSIKPASMVANWLYGVARNTAQKARALIRKRRVRERQPDVIPEPAQEPKRDKQDLREIIDLELAHLSANYRTPILLCDLEGLSRTEACQRLGWLDGTLSGRLARGRAMLARRLIRRGFGTVVAGSTGAFTSRVLAVGAARPAPLASVLMIAKDGSPVVLAKSGISPFALNLAAKVSRAMSIAVLTRALFATLVVTAVVSGSGLAFYRIADEQVQQKTGDSTKAKLLAKAPRTETDCLNEMRESAQKEWELRLSEFSEGRGQLDPLYDAAGRLLKANLGLAKSDEARVNPFVDQLARMVSLEKTIKRRFDAVQMDSGSYERAKFARSEAELNLIRERTRAERER